MLLNRVLLFGVIIVIALPTGIFSGWLPFLFNTVRCMRLPVESTRFAAAYSYRLPGDEDYGVHSFSEYNYCTEVEIKATNGYHRSMLIEAGRRENEAEWANYRESEKFSLSKVNYTVYRPRGYEISSQK